MSTNPKPEPIEFDPSEELTRLGDTETYGLSTRVWFYLLQTCRAVESFSTPSFTIDSVFGPPGLTPAGCFVEFIVRKHVFWVDTHTRVKLWTASADDADGARNRYLVHDGNATDPASWESLLIEVGRVEKFGVLIPHADTLRRMWSEWLVEQKRREDERGF